MSLPRLHISRGREKSLLRRHPWIYSGAIKKVEGVCDAGDTVEVVDADGKLLGKAAWSPLSQLQGRMWSFDPAEEIDENFFRRRIKAAVSYRELLGMNDPTGGCRLIFSEADGLPGVIVDRYGEYAAVQFLSCGAEKHREMIGKLLLEVPGIAGVFDRSDASIRQKEGLPGRCEMLCGKELPDMLEIVEDGLRYGTDLRRGQKTGFYFDLRMARREVRSFAGMRRVLNVFSYTGAFACAALSAGAESVLNLDSSRPALEQAAYNLQLNGFEKGWENRAGDAFTLLRELVNKKEKFDLVILDPPKLINSKNALVRGCRGYQDLARLGFQLLNPGGVLFNFSCSGLMELDLFQKITASAAVEAGVDGRIIRTLRQSPDHPVRLSVPETFYLKGLVTVID